MSLRSLEQVLGAEVKRRREAAGVRQEAVAIAAQAYDLAWGQATVSALEAGRRVLAIGELALLPLILRQAKISRTFLRIMDLIPETDETVVMAGTLQVPLRVARSLFSALPRPPKHKSVSESLGLGETLSYRVFRAGQRTPVTEADRKAARKLRTTPTAIGSAAYTLWGHDLAQERDRRLGAAVTTLPPRSLQAVRGRVTRALTRELQPILKTARRKKR